MLVEHTAEGGTLALSLAPDLDVSGRAAAALRIQALVLAYRPGLVRVHMTPGLPSTAALSVLARLRRLCEGLGIPLALSCPPAATMHGHGDADGHPAVAGAVREAHRGASS
ncbi:hypothetical protein ACFTUC_29395 [Streptomyces sp. NPDC056944]|uniref:hypothetical protein n=1 Tax=unclassified Streptomyces TaxID=2593676 RepID=UPI00362DF66E